MAPGGLRGAWRIVWRDAIRALAMALEFEADVDS